MNDGPRSHPAAPSSPRGAEPVGMPSLVIRRVDALLIGVCPARGAGGPSLSCGAVG
jgi:hypothetical protein